MRWPPDSDLRQAHVVVQRASRWAWRRVMLSESAPAPAMPTLPDARRYRVAALLGRALLESGNAGMTDPLVQEHLKALGVAAVIGTQAREICDTLDDAGVTCVLIKGAAVLAREPRLRGLRPMADVDVLIDGSRWEEARRALKSAGYVQAESDELDESRTMTLVHPLGMRASVDVHRLLIEEPVLAEIVPLILSSRERIESVWVPSVAWMRAISALHAIRDTWAKGVTELLDLGVAPSMPPADALPNRAARIAVEIAWHRRTEWFGDVEPASTGVLLRPAIAWRRANEVHNRDADMPRGLDLWRHYLSLIVAGVPAAQVTLAMGTRLALRARRASGELRRAGR